MDLKVKYRLKNQELQKKLDELTGGLFSIELANALTFSDEKFITLECLRISKSSVEKVVEYDPKAWNNYPEVTPPEGVWMRCERPNDLCVDGIERMCMKWMVDEQGGFWTDDCESGDFDYDSLRFRPWED